MKNKLLSICFINCRWVVFPSLGCIYEYHQQNTLIEILSFATNHYASVYNSFVIR